MKLTIGGNASINLTLIRILPLILGNIISEECNTWKLVMILKDIVEISLASRLTLDMIAYLEYQIDLHKSLFLQLFPNQKMKAKHHFIEHYPQALLNYGPLIHCWCMRFEGKHQYFKNVIKRCRNFKNPLKILAEKHCRLMAYHLSSINFFNAKTLISNSNSIHRSFLEEKLCTALDMINGFNSNFIECKSISVNGIKYSKNQIVFISVNSPNFGKIKSIWYLSEEVYFWCEYQTSIFNGHLHVFELGSTNNCSLISYSNLIDYYLLEEYNLSGPKISLHHALPELM